MKKILLAVITVFSVSNLYAKPPKISGNYETGDRYAIDYEEDEIDYSYLFGDAEEADQEAWAYKFDKGYLQLSQTVNDRVRYVIKYDYLDKDFFAATSDATNNSNRLNYYRAYAWFGLTESLKLKAEYYLRAQDYEHRDWNNLSHVPHLLLQWSPAKTRTADVSLRYKAQRYDDETEAWKDKNQVDSYIGYREKLTDSLTLNARYKYTFRAYDDNPDQSDAIKKSFSAGFDYQF